MNFAARALQILILSLGWLVLVSSSTPFRSGFETASADTISSVNTSASLESTIANRIIRVPEFEFIRKEAERIGVRAWLFGGTAAGYAHYVNWDTKRENGDTRFHPLRFDYDYTNIYRSNQDLDIVIDGTAAQAQALQARLAKTYPHLQGNKSAWEVRLLKHSLGTPGQPGWKEALLNNSDFLNQHTDSNSTGMIEITLAPANEPTIRDLRDWTSKEPYFLKDVKDGKLHFYFSETHSSTSRARAGINPPILAVIRYLTKAFQYDLQMRDEDLVRVKKIIDEFDPKSLGNKIVRDWIERNGKKLVQNAVDIEHAFEQMDALGIRKKLIAVAGNPNSKSALAWWLSREPLRTYAVGVDPKTDQPAKGPTAKELGLSTVAHETSDFEAYESITRDHTGRPNVLISRNGFIGEAAVYGDGFYTRIGRQGARGSKITIRFTLDPNARRGTDFTQSGDYIVVHNRAALQVIPESLNLSPVQYFEFLVTGKGVGDSDRGALEKLRRRTSHQYHLLSTEDYLTIAKIIKKRLRWSREGIFPVLQEWFSLPRSGEFSSESIRFGTTLLRNADLNDQLHFIEKTLSQPGTKAGDPWVQAIIERKDSFNSNDRHIAESALNRLFALPHTHSWTQAMHSFIQSLYSGNDIKSFIKNVLSKPDVKDGEALLLTIVKRKNSFNSNDRQIAESALNRLFALPHTHSWTQAMHSFIQSSYSGNDIKSFIENVLSKPDVKDGEALLLTIVKRKNSFNSNDRQIAESALEKLLKLPHTQNWSTTPPIRSSCLFHKLKNLLGLK